MVTVPFVLRAQEAFLETLMSDIDGKISISQSADAIHLLHTSFGN